MHDLAKIAALNEGDYFRDGKLYDANGNEVRVTGAEDHHGAPAAPRPKVAAATTNG